jgi:rRNA biogenesis protein RRP5
VTLAHALMAPPHSSLCAGHTDNARRLFERAIHLNSSTKKMKFFFKKYLDFEMKNGTEATVQHVRDAAKAYVESVSA